MFNKASSSRRSLVGSIAAASAAVATAALQETNLARAAARRRRSRLFATARQEEAPLAYAGALAFSPGGVLFVGDNVAAKIVAFELGQGAAPEGEAGPLAVANVDARIGEALGVAGDLIEINGMVVHPVTREVYLSVSRGAGDGLLPAIVRIDRAGQISNVDLMAAPSSEHAIATAPTPDQHFRSRAKDWPVPSAFAYEAKAETPMSSMTIVDMKFHDGELFASGISNQEFASTLRRIAYPFDGAASESRVRIYHLSHQRYETRAPIRAMQIASIGGADTLVAAYTCSPLVLLPLAELQDGAKVTGKTIGDMGNGQPLSMVPVTVGGQDTLFVTNMARTPVMIPLAGLADAVGYTPENAPAGPVYDLSPVMPIGPVGKAVMFVGSSLFADRLDDQFIVSVTRDAASGALNLESLPIEPLPMTLDQIWSEFDFPGGEFGAPQ